MKQIYLVPNIITAFGLACGLFVIFKINMIEPGSGTYEVINSSALLLLLAAFADFIDGAIARVLKAESEFGVAFDSLADAISFGVAPAVLLLKSLSLKQGSFLSFLAAIGCMIYVLCGILRLVRFNVKKNDVAVAQNKNFMGLPITAGAAASVSANLLFFTPYFANFIGVTPYVRAVILSFIMIALGYFMIGNWQFPSLKSLRYRVPSFQLVILSVVIAVLFLYGILHYFSIVLAFLSWSYILVSLIFVFIRYFSKKS